MHTANPQTVLAIIDFTLCEVESTICEKGGLIGGQQCLKGEQRHLLCFVLSHCLSWLGGKQYM